MDTVKVVLSENGLSGEETQKRVFGGNLSEISTPHRSGNMCDTRRR